jgi:ATP-dependent DNA helicase RecQ
MPGVTDPVLDRLDTAPPAVRAAPPGAPAAPRDVLREALRAELHEVFGHAAFRGLQAEVVTHVAAGGDALVLMPTGAGKSVCYQLPAIHRHRRGLGVTLVVSPLIALMQDQVGALAELGVAAAFLNSTLEGAEAARVERELLAGRLVLLYAAPERILTPRFLGMLDSLAGRGLFAGVAIDEAHCVSQWGHDFRAEYLGLSQLHERYPAVPRLALTATADEHTREDIAERLALVDAPRFVASFDRPNIRYTIVEKGSEPRRQLLALVREHHPRDAGIVYCATRRKVEDTAAWLAEQGVAALPYHAGLDVDVRQRHQARFLRHDADLEGGLVMVATIAFGMGIDKPDVRFVAHLDLPKTIESYYQETGRAGRDGAPADAWMAYGLADVVNQRRLIDDGEADEAFKRVQRGKLEALLALAESHECRRARLLAYFGEHRAEDGAPAAEAGPPRWRCGNCDNCVEAPSTWDATEAARMALSCVYRLQQASGTGYGSGHVIDVLRGQVTEKVRDRGHERLSTFGIGAALGEAPWRAVLRQLLAAGHLRTEGEYGVLALTPESRAVLRGEVPVVLRVAAEAAAGGGRRKRAARTGRAAAEGAPATPSAEPGSAEAARLAALKAWRSATAKAHNVPAYVVFHDATLEAMARERPLTLEALSGIGGVGARKLETYGLALISLLSSE